MEVQFWATTDTGLARDHNEDNFLVDRDLGLFVVCDGMGGHAAGEVASALSVQVIQQVLLENRAVLDEFEQDPGQEAGAEAVLALLDQAISEACRRVYSLAQADPDRHGMGTTCCLLLLLGGRGFVGHVGDSRIYQLRANQAEQITEDHSLINEMIRQGRAKEGDSIPNKNAVTRAVGVREMVDVDTFALDVRRDDLFILCSDGFSGYIDSEAQLLGLVDDEDLEAGAHRCIEHALNCGGKDNITTILVRVGDTMAPRQTLMDSATAQILRACPYFSYATPSEISQLCDIVDRHAFEAGDTIIEADRSADCLCLIVNGSVGVVGGHVGVTVLDAGDTFGEVSLFYGAQPLEGYEALAPTRLIVLRREPFFALLRARPALAAKVLYGLATKMAAQLHRVPAELRYEPHLWDEVSIQGGHTPMPGFMVMKDVPTRPSNAVGRDAIAQEPPPLKHSKTKVGAKSSVKKGPLGPPPHASLTKNSKASAKNAGTGPLEQRPLPPRPVRPLDDDEDDIETQQSVVLDDLRKTMQFDRDDDKYDKL